MNRAMTGLWLVFVALTGDALADPTLPIQSGEYVFRHRDAEFPNSRGFSVNVTIRGNKATVVNPKPYGPIPAGVLDEATLVWRPRSSQWILSHDAADREAPEVGGCSGGPQVIDLESRTIWTCEGGP